VSKFSRAIPFNFKVIGAQLLHFESIFDPPLNKIVRKAASPMKNALVRLGHSLARVKNMGRSTP